MGSWLICAEISCHIFSKKDPTDPLFYHWSAIFNLSGPSTPLHLKEPSDLCIFGIFRCWSVGTRYNLSKTVFTLEGIKLIANSFRRNRFALNLVSKKFVDTESVFSILAGHLVCSVMNWHRKLYQNCLLGLMGIRAMLSGFVRLMFTALTFRSKVEFLSSLIYVVHDL